MLLLTFFLDLGRKSHFSYTKCKKRPISQKFVSWDFTKKKDNNITIILITSIMFALTTFDAETTWLFQV